MTTFAILARHRALLAEVDCKTITYDQAAGVFLIDGKPITTMAPTLGELSAAGLIRRDPDATDNTIPIVLTTAGEAVLR